MIKFYRYSFLFLIFIFFITLTGCDSFNSNLNLPDTQNPVNTEVVMDKKNVEAEVLNLINTYSSLQSTSSYKDIIKMTSTISQKDSQVIIKPTRVLNNTYIFRRKASSEPWQNIAFQPGAISTLSDSPNQSGDYQYLILSFTDSNIYYSTNLSISYQIGTLSAPKISFDISGCYLGFSSEDTSVASFTGLAAKKPALSGIFVSFSDNNNLIYPQKYLSRLTEIKSAGSIPFITWEPWDAYKSTTNLMPYILTGTYDDLIDNWAQVLASLNYPVIIRFAHEMNGNWYPWSDDPVIYKNAFKYVVNRFKAKGAINVSWCFAPNWDNAGTGRNYYDYFPGTSYVDCLGISGYNSGNTQSWSVWRDFSGIYKNAATDLYNRYHLPIILDLASVESGGDKSAWITDMANKLKTSEFTMVKGIVWFEYQKYESGILTDWRINSSEASLTSFREAVGLNYFLSEPVVNEIKIF